MRKSCAPFGRARRAELQSRTWSGPELTSRPPLSRGGSWDRLTMLFAFADEFALRPISRTRRTSIPAMLNKAHLIVGSNGLRELRRVVDVSGDGPNNSGPPVVKARKGRSGLARLSHRGCGRHGGQMADRQGENRRSMWFIVQDFRRSMSAIWPRPSGSPRRAIGVVERLNRMTPYAFRRSPSRVDPPWAMTLHYPVRKAG